LLSTEKFRPRQCVWDKTEMQKKILSCLRLFNVPHHFLVYICAILVNMMSKISLFLVEERS
jgi:hypothetical protein